MITLWLAEDCERNLLFGETRRHLARLDVERDNLFLALAWAPRIDDVSPGLRLSPQRCVAPGSCERCQHEAPK